MSNHKEIGQVQQRSTGAVAVLLWTMLAISAAANVAGQYLAMDTFLVRVVAGGVAILSIVLLVVYYMKRRNG